MSEEREDGVNREGLDYRAGYVEALGVLLTNLQLQAIRCAKKEEPGLRAAFDTVKNVRAAMIQKMKGGA